MASPLLGIIDTVAVGLTSPALELSALGPGTALADSTAYFFTFISVATTGLVARALARSSPTDAQRFVAEALTLAAWAGVGLGLFLFAFSPGLLTLWTGTAGSSAVLVAPASVYVNIRCLGYPFAFLAMVAQSAFLAAKQPLVPLFTILISSACNLAGDLVLCWVFGMGLAGAAWATVASQVVAAAIILCCLLRPYAAGQPALLATPPSLLPSHTSCLRFLRVGGPVCVLIAVKILLISVGLGGAATSLSPASSAAHACAMSLYLLAATMGDGISQAAQTFLPAQLGRPDAAFRLCGALMLTALCVGIFNASWAGVIPAFAPSMFTPDMAVGAHMRSIAPIMSIALLCHAVSMATEGLLLAGRDLKWLVISYARNAALCFVSLELLNRAGWGLVGVWLVFVQFHASRLVQNAHRMYVSEDSPVKKVGMFTDEDE
jgi:putative MATE family efflux protein